MNKRLFSLAIATLIALQNLSAQPRLIVEIAVGSMRAEEIGRYASNFGNKGFNLLTVNGTNYTACSYDFQQTTTPVTLSTLSTGAMPSTHGVIGEEWIDYTTNRRIALTDGRQGTGAYQLVAPTLSETMRQHLPGAQTVTIAAEPTSAVVLAGKGGEVFWLDTARCDWTTSLYYAREMPEWIARSNKERYNLSYILSEWRPALDRAAYLNTRHFDIVLEEKKSKDRTEYFKPVNDYERLLYTPAGNTAILGMAKQAIAHYKMGDDATCDLLCISLDPARRITETYGPESIEVEDMYYRIDRDLTDFLTFVFAQVKDGNALVVLTSDHGTSPSFDRAEPAVERFNTRQFEVIVNGFLNVRYGMGNWVIRYADKSLWLNHNLIYERGLNLADVQNEVAIFAMQFEGVSHALAASAMRTSYFGSGYARRMQNSYYPRRSGDVILNLVPGCIEESDQSRSLSGSMYGYDTEVPLIFYGKGAPVLRIKRRVEISSVAPTLARIAGISEPAASEGCVLEEFDN